MKISTDRGYLGSCNKLLRKWNRTIKELYFKGEYFSGSGFPDRYSCFLKSFDAFPITPYFLARHKFYHFRKWSQNELKNVLFDLITVKFIISFIDRPLQFFGFIGLILGGIGFAILMILTIGFYFFDWIIRENLGNLIFGVFMMILGLQFIMTGLLAEIISRIYFTTHKMKIYSVSQLKSHTPSTNKEGDSD